MRHLLSVGLSLCLALGIFLSAAHAQVFVATSSGVREYSTSDVLLNSNFISASNAKDVFYNNGDLYVETASTIGVYNAYTGTAINSSFITGLSSASYVTASGGNLYVLANNKVAEYNMTSGTVVNSSLISGLSSTPESIATNGTNIFVANYNNTSGTVAEYTMSGTLVNANFITSLAGGADGLYIDPKSGYLYVTDQQYNSGGEAGNHVGVFNATTGTAINRNLAIIPASVASYGLLDLVGDGTDLYVSYYGSSSGLLEVNEATGATIGSPITGLSSPYGVAEITAAATPEPKSLTFALIVLAASGLLYARQGRLA